MKVAGRRKSEKGNGRTRARRVSSGAWKIIYFFIFILLLVDGFFAYSLVERAGRNPAAERPVTPEPVSVVPGEQAIRVEVLNGSGRGGVAREMTDYLRSRGFDVIDYGNAESQSFYETVVLDRTGDRVLAEQLAGAIGARHVLQQKNPYLALDVTLIMGHDYEQLLPFVQERRHE